MEQVLRSRIQAFLPNIISIGRMPEDIPEDMPGRISKNIPDRMPENMPDKIPKCLPDRMPENLPNNM